jgi:glucokinase
MGYDGFRVGCAQFPVRTGSGHLRIAIGPEQSPPSRPAHLRRANSRHLLRLIQTHNPCSKADLVRYSGLSAPTITSCVAVLEKLDLVEAIGDGQSNGGRPPGLLRFNAKHGYVAAADIGGTRLRMMLADLSGTALTQWSQVLRGAQKTPAGVCALLCEGLKKMCEASEVAPSRVMHLTAGAPGITDVGGGVVLSAPNLTDWNDVSLRSMLQTSLNIPVVVENDTNLAALGEHLCGAAREVANFVFLAIGTGVGAGIFLDGHLHHGATWSAGEVGYFGVGGKARQPTRMRQAGQLEGVIGGGGIEMRWRKTIARGKSKRRPERPDLTATQILDLAAQGDRAACEVATKTASLLADAIADIALLLNPQMVILGGGVGSHPELCRLTCCKLGRHELASRLVIRSSALGTQAQLRGAVSTSLEAMHTLILPN